MDNEQTVFILESLAKITKQIDALKPQAEPYRSAELNELFAALAKAQAEFNGAIKNRANSFTNNPYADLNSVIDVSRPALAKNGLSVMQNLLENGNGQTILHTILAHSSGQWIESRVKIIPAKNDIQSFGSCVTYNRRYAYSSLVGVSFRDDDDDGEAEVAHLRKKEKGLNLESYNPRKNDSAETITADQLKEIDDELREYPALCEEILDKLQIRSLSAMPKNLYRRIMERIRERIAEIDAE